MFNSNLITPPLKKNPKKTMFEIKRRTACGSQVNINELVFKLAVPIAIGIRLEIEDS
tara:strand:- start:16965 stop:17135 length:171 start_codon:yes stop_codon:yes gene_type:complete